MSLHAAAVMVTLRHRPFRPVPVRSRASVGLRGCARRSVSARDLPPRRRGGADRDTDTPHAAWRQQGRVCVGSVWHFVLITEPNSRPYTPHTEIHRTPPDPDRIHRHSDRANTRYTIGAGAAISHSRLSAITAHEPHSASQDKTAPGQMWVESRSPQRAGRRCGGYGVGAARA